MQRYTFAVHMSGCKLLYIVIDFQRILMITYFKTKAYTNVLNIGLGQCLVVLAFMWHCLLDIVVACLTFRSAVLNLDSITMELC